MQKRDILYIKPIFYLLGSTMEWECKKTGIKKRGICTYNLYCTFLVQQWNGNAKMGIKKTGHLYIKPILYLFGSTMEWECIQKTGHLHLVGSGPGEAVPVPEHLDVRDPAAPAHYSGVFIS